MGRHIRPWRQATMCNALVHRYITVSWHMPPPSQVLYHVGNLDPHRIHGFLNPHKSASQTTSQSTISVEITRVPNTPRHRDRQTDTQTTVHATSVAIATGCIYNAGAYTADMASSGTSHGAFCHTTFSSLMNNADVPVLNCYYCQNSYYVPLS